MRGFADAFLGLSRPRFVFAGAAIWMILATAITLTARALPQEPDERAWLVDDKEDSSG